MAKAATATVDKAPTFPTVSTSMPDLTAGDQAHALSNAGADNGGTAPTVAMVPLGNIKLIKGFNPRFKQNPDYEKGIVELANSIAYNGFYATKPIVGFVAKEGEADVIFVTDGHRRLEATQRANILRAGMKPPLNPIQLLPVILKEGATDMVSLTIALVRENEGKRLEGVEQAVVVKRLLKAGLKESDIADKLQMGTKWVGELVKLIQAPKAIREAAMAGKISATEAIRILNKHGIKEKDAEGKAIPGKVDYRPAEKVVTEMISRAEAAGAARATRAASDDGTKGGEVKAGIKMESLKIEWGGDAGHKFTLSEVAGFAAMISDNDWYTLIDEGAEPAKAVLTENVRFKATISRPKKEAPPTEKPAEDGKVDNTTKLGDDPAADL